MLFLVLVADFFVLLLVFVNGIVIFSFLVIFVFVFVNENHTVSESRMMWAISVSILVFLVLSVLDLSPMYAPDAYHRLMPPTLGRGHNNHAYNSYF